MNDELAVEVGRVASLKGEHEPCLLTMSRSKLVVLLEGPKTLACHPIDEIEAVLTAAVSSTTWLVLLRTSDLEADLVLFTSTVDAARSIAQEVRTLRKLRQSRVAAVIKFIEYSVTGEHTVASLLMPNGVSCVKWSKGMSAALPPFPHTRLDFLRLHTNRSVMQKVSSYGDSIIELSCDNVLALGSAMGTHLAVSASSVACAPLSEIERIISSGAVEETFVLLLTDKSGYLTRHTGNLVCRFALDSISWPRLIGTQDVVITVSSDQWLILRSKYAHDIYNRLRLAHPHTFATGFVPGQLDSPAGTLQATAVQTDDTKDDASSLSLFHLRSRVHELEDKVKERDATIAVLRRRLDVVVDTAHTTQSSKGKSTVRVDQEVEVLRHYASLLEHRVDEMTASASTADYAEHSHDPFAALAEAQQREAKLRGTVQRLSSELEEVSRSFQRSLDEIGSKAVASVKAFVQSYERKGHTAQKAVQITTPACTAQCRRLHEVNCQLIEELRDRDRLLEDLAKSECVDHFMPKNGTGIYSRLEKASLACDSLEAELLSLQDAVRAAKDELSLLVSDRHVTHLQHAATQKILSSLNNVAIQANRVANLEVLLLQSSARKVNGLVTSEKLCGAEKEISSLKSQLLAAQQRLKKKHVSPSPRRGALTSRQSTPSPQKDADKNVALRRDAASIPIALSPDRDDETRKFHAELDAQRRAFEQRLQDLEMVAFRPSNARHVSDSMGVVDPRHSSSSPARQIATLEAENILLRSRSPRGEKLSRRPRR